MFQKGKWMITVLATILLAVKFSSWRHGLPLLDPSDLIEEIAENEVRDKYDFIVIGSGPGGSTVASRLSEDSSWNVLLLEAGGDETSLHDIPILTYQFKNTKYDWAYRAQPQPGSCQGIKDGRCPFIKGKCLGGTTSINSLLYTRGHSRDYDDWEKLGNPGWGWDNVLPYFLKSENANEELRHSPNHATGGPLDVGTAYSFPIIDAFLKSGVEMGLNELPDINSGSIMGFYTPHFTQRNGSRCSASKAFLRPARYRKNLHIMINAHVTRVLIDQNTMNVQGVEYYKNGHYHTVIAKREVIISAGAINTPQLLMLSGIGPGEHLSELGIPVLIDMPGVGQNLQEHVETPYLTFLVNETVTLVGKRMVTDIASMLKYFISGNGPLTTTGIGALGFVKTTNSTYAQDYPDIELIFAPASLASDGGTSFNKVIGVRDDIYNTVYAPLHGKDTFSIWPMLIRPRSKGWIHLQSKDPFVYPLLYGNFFDDENDLLTMVEGLKFAVKLSKTNAFQRYNSKLHDVPLPGCTHLRFASDAYWTCVVRVMTYSGQHHCCTAKMGPKSDEMSVVDHELRVHGVHGLRVIDASIMPFITAAHPMAPIYMIAEKATELIKLANTKATNDSRGI
jgi:choline dehydrogenase